jgi:uncharacterized membrane protein YraQ (UPF0718 family)
MLDGILYIIVVILLILSFVKDKTKTKKALKKAWKAFLKNLKMLIGMMILMGVVFTLINPEFIGQLFGEESGLVGVLLGIGIGSATFIPSFIAFPLGAGLIENGAGYPQVAGFISSLMGVGVISIGMEVEYFGKQAAIIRNVFAVIASIVFVIVIGGVM